VRARLGRWALAAAATGALAALVPVPTSAQAPAASPASTLSLPLKEGSVRFLVMGDTGQGDAGQYDTAREMAALRQQFPCRCSPRG
jgi:hypothetical protein